MSAFSIGVYILVYFAKFHEGLPIHDFEPYFSRPNWYLYPLFFLIIAFPVHFSWYSFCQAWQHHCSKKGVITNSSPKLAEECLNDFRLYRRWILGLAVFFSLFLNILEDRDLFKLYYPTKNITYVDQLKYACDDPAFLERPFLKYESQRSNPINRCFDVRPERQYTKREYEKLERDKYEYYKKLLRTASDIFDSKKTESPFSEANAFEQIAMWSCVLQQFIMWCLGFVVLFQILVQGIVFWFFDKTQAAKRHNATIKFKLAPARDFGLYEWNVALSNLFWAMSPALFFAAVSKWKQPPGDLDAGWAIAYILLIIVAIAPWLLPFVTRTRWKRECRKRVYEEPINSENLRLFHEQKLWPMDETFGDLLWNIPIYHDGKICF